MLVLKRKLHEGVCIGDNIYLKILEITPTAIRLGIDAPIEIAVDRDEVRARISHSDSTTDYVRPNDRERKDRDRIA